MQATRNDTDSRANHLAGKYLTFLAHEESYGITTVQGRAEVVDVRVRLIPLLRLDEHFVIYSSSRRVEDGIIIVAQSGVNVRCLLVDGLENQQAGVIKNLNNVVSKKPRSLAGAAILGDGTAGLIPDVNPLVQLERESLANAA